MMSLPLASGSLSWYLTRSTGAVALILLTASVVLGVADVRRISSERWPRFVIDALHRNVALLSVIFLVVHIITAVLDTFTSIPLIDAVVPFIGSYRPFWLGLGAVSFDLILAVTITSLLRQRLGYSTWRAVHWLSYASWPIALVHGLGTGSDTKGTWMLTLDLLCLVAVFFALGTRLSTIWPNYPERGRATLGGAVVFLVFLAFWVPSGPLATDWAKRSGTPTTNLHHTPSGAKR
jgi:methionine sulfoxide reductase heme-binding subunit